MASSKEIDVKLKLDAKQAQADLKAVSGQLDDLDPETTVKVTADTDSAESNVKTVEEGLNRIDSMDVVADIKANIDQAEAQVDSLQQKLHNIDDTPMSGVEGSLNKVGNAAEGVDKKTANAKSVMANFAGNATQELPGVASAFGPLNQAFSEFVEKGAEGQLALKSVIAAGAGMGAVSLAIGFVSSALKGVAESKAFNKKEIEAWTKQLDEGKRSIDDIAQRFVDLGKVEFSALGGLAKGDLTGLLTKAGISVTQFATMVKGGAPAFQEWAKEAEAAGISVDLIDGIMIGAGPIVDDYAEAVKNAALMAKFHNEQLDGEAHGLDDVNKGTKAIILTEEQAAGVREVAAKEHEEQIQQQVADTLKLNAETKAYLNTLKSSDWGATRIGGAVTAMHAFTTEHNALIDLHAQGEAALDAFTESMHKNGKSFDVNTEKGRNNQAALEDLAGTIDDRLAAAYTAADGNQTKFDQSATKLSLETLARLQKDMHLSAKETQDLGDRLGLMPDDITTRYHLADAEVAKEKLTLLQGSIDNLPKDVQTKVTQQIIEGDYVGALRTVQDYNNDHIVKMPTEVAEPLNKVPVHDSTSLFFANNPVNIPTKLLPPSAKSIGTHLLDEAAGGFVNGHYEFYDQGHTAGGFVGGGGHTTIINNFPPGVSPVAFANAQREYKRRGGR